MRSRLQTLFREKIVKIRRSCFSEFRRASDLAADSCFADLLVEVGLPRFSLLHFRTFALVEGENRRQIRNRQR
jgi:hypothetical protein